MSAPSETVTPRLLRQWPLPDPGISKRSRGQVLVVGGSRRSPGAPVLAAEAALRVGAGRLGVAVPSSAAADLGAVMPETGVLRLPDRGPRRLPRDVRQEIAAADAVLTGPGLDDPRRTRAILLAVAAAAPSCLVLDAFALGILPGIDRALLPERLVLNPNRDEAAILLGRRLSGDLARDVVEIARRYRAVVNCYGHFADPAGASWRVRDGGPELGSSGSGDVLAGAMTGFIARGLDPVRGAAWGSWTHARAGARLARRRGIGFLARELAAELAPTVRSVTG